MGCSLDFLICLVLSLLLLFLILSHLSSVPRRRCTCCLGSKITFFCGKIGFATGLTGWVHSSWLFIISDAFIVSFSNIGVFVVRVRVCLTTVSFINFIASTNFIAFSLAFLSLELTELYSIVARFFAVMTCRYGFFSVLFCGMLHHHSVHLKLVWGFKIF